MVWCVEYDYGNVNKKTSVLVAVIGQSVRARQCARCRRPIPEARALGFAPKKICPKNMLVYSMQSSLKSTVSVH